MKKIIKSGFSLAELLVSLAIISVIAIMGTNIAKRGIDNAANMYFYNAFSALDAAVNDAWSADIKLDGSNNLQSDENSAFFNRIANTLDIEEANRVFDNGRLTLTARNNVSFRFSAGSQYQDNNGNDFRVYDITITIPRKSNNQARCRLLADSDHQVHLFPTEVTAADIAGGVVDMLGRIDLLPTAVSDGVRGKIRYNVDTQTTAPFQPLVYTNYRDAYCQIYPSVAINGLNYINCNNMNNRARAQTEPNSTLVIGNPRKVL